MKRNKQVKQDWERVRRTIGSALIENLGFEKDFFDYLIACAEEDELMEMVDIVAELLQHAEKGWMQDDLDKLIEGREKKQILPAAYRDFIESAPRREELLVSWSLTIFLRGMFNQKKALPLSIPEGIARFCDTFNLSESEGRIIAFFYVVESDDQLRMVIKNAGPSSLAEMFSSLIGTDVITLSELLGKNGKLTRCGIILPNRRADSLADFQLNNSVHMIIQTGNMERFREHLFLPNRENRYRGDQFPVAEEEADDCSA